MVRLLTGFLFFRGDGMKSFSLHIHVTETTRSLMVREAVFARFQVSFWNRMGGGHCFICHSINSSVNC